MGLFKLIALAIPLHAYYLFFSIVQDFNYIYFLKSLIQKWLRGGENRGQKGILYLNFPETDKLEIGKITMTSASGQSRVVRAGTC